MVRYERISTTEGMTARITEDESYFSYELTKSVRVEAGDVLGIEMGSLCRSSAPFDNIQSLNMSTAPRSYWRTFGTTSFFLDSSANTEDNLIPLVQAIIGQLDMYNV